MHPGHLDHPDALRAALARLGLDVAPPGRGVDSRDLVGTVAVVDVSGHTAARVGAVAVVEAPPVALAVTSDEVSRMVDLCDLGDPARVYRWIVEHPAAVRRKAPAADGARVRPRRGAAHP